MLSSGRALSLGARDAVEVEPARGQVHVHGERVAPGGLELAGEELRPPVLLEGQGEVGQGGAGCVGVDVGLQVERRRRRLGLGLGAGTLGTLARSCRDQARAATAPAIGSRAVSSPSMRGLPIRSSRRASSM